MLVFLISSEIRKPQHFCCSIRQNILDWNMSCKIFIFIFFCNLKSAIPFCSSFVWATKRTASNIFLIKDKEIMNSL